MATIYAHDGDTVVISRKEYRVNESSEGPELLPIITACDACHKIERGVEFTSAFGNLCGVCITTAMEVYYAQLAINHLMCHDDEIVEVLHIMERYDNDANSSGRNHVDFHSSAIDNAWGMSEDDVIQFGMSIASSIARVIESRTLLERA